MLALVLLLSLVAIHMQRALACSCVSSGLPDQELARSVAVFAGKVGDRNIVGMIGSFDSVQVTFQVSTVWKGPVQKNLIVTTASSSASCGYAFQVGQKYLVYANGNENQLHVSLCSRTKPLVEADEDLAELGNGVLLPIENVDWLSYLSAMFVFFSAGVGVVMAIVIGKRTLSGIGIKKIHLALNPVLVKELRGRMRGPRAYLFLTATLALLGGVSYGLYRLAAFSMQTFNSGPPGAIIGQSTFTGLIFLALIVMCAIAPSLTAGAISSEYERKTFDLLAATPLHPSSILFGKLAAALSYVVLILLAAVPLVSLSFVFGGVATMDMVQALLLLLGFALTYSVIGMFFSALFRRTAFAVVASYIVLALFVFGTVFVYAVVAVIRQQQPPNWMLALNPFSAMASALVPANLSPNMSSMFGFITPLLFFVGGGNINFNPGIPAQRPLWQYTMGIYGWLTIVLYLVSTQLVKPVQRFRFRARSWAIIALFSGASILAAPIVYGPLTPDRILAAMRWALSSPRDLVANGKFTAPLEQDWKTGLQREGDDQVRLVRDGDQTIAQFSRRGEDHFETSLTQVISQTVPQDGWLQVRAVIRVQTQDVQGCGTHGDECPLAFRLNYDDAQGGKHLWLQAFHVSSDEPVSCGPCEIHPMPIRVPQGKWYTFESPNLMQYQYQSSKSIPPPHLIRSISVWAAGHSYEAEVAQVALLVREGHPLDFGSETNSFATPTPVPRFFVAPMMAPPVAPVPMMPPPPPPTSVPPPTPTPSMTPTPTPAKP